MCGPGEDWSFVSTAQWEGYGRRNPATRRIQVALLLAGVATFVLLYNTQAILPQLSRTYDLTPSSAALSVSLATAGLGVGLLLAAPLSDRYGRTALIHFSLLSAGAVGIAIAFIPDWRLFLLARFVQGVLLAGLPATAAVYLREEMNNSIVAAATGVYIFGTTIGGLLSRLGASWVAELATGWPTWRLGPVAMDEVHLALLATGLFSFACAVACRLLLPASRGFRAERNRPAELLRIFGRAFTDRVLVGIYAMAALMMGTFIGVFNVLGFRLEAAPYHLSVGVVGLIFLVYPVAGYASALAGRAADRYSVRAVMPVGVVLAIAGLTLLGLPWLPVIVLGALVFATGFFVTHAVASSWVATRAAMGVGHPAQAASIYMIFYYAGSSISGNLTPLAWQHEGWAGVMVACGSLMAVALAVSIALARSRSILR